MAAIQRSAIFTAAGRRALMRSCSRRLGATSAAAAAAAGGPAAGGPAAGAPANGATWAYSTWTASSRTRPDAAGTARIVPTTTSWVAPRLSTRAVRRCRKRGDAGGAVANSSSTAPGTARATWASTAPTRGMTSSTRSGEASIARSGEASMTPP